MPRAIFSTAYMPSIEYISMLLKFSSIEIEQYENFKKQSVRNRCHILSANGKQTLTIPVLHEQKNKIFTRDIKICYDEPWQRIHWSAFYSAYNKSPFFEFYKDEFEKIIFSNKSFLLDINSDLLHLIIKILKAQVEIKFTSNFEKKYPVNDFRFLSDAKSTCNLQSSSLFNRNNHQYQQVFHYKYGFVSNLSIVDLIFNESNAAKDYLY